jgi:hypothetical protein
MRNILMFLLSMIAYAIGCKGDSPCRYESHYVHGKDSLQSYIYEDSGNTIDSLLNYPCGKKPKQGISAFMVAFSNKEDPRIEACQIDCNDKLSTRSIVNSWWVDQYIPAEKKERNEYQGSAMDTTYHAMCANAFLHIENILEKRLYNKWPKSPSSATFTRPDSTTSK